MDKNLRTRAGQLVREQRRDRHLFHGRVKHGTADSSHRGTISQVHRTFASPGGETRGNLVPSAGAVRAQDDRRGFGGDFGAGNALCWMFKYRG